MASVSRPTFGTCAEPDELVQMGAWSNHRIKIRNETHYQQAFDIAIGWYNASPVDISLVTVGPGAAADIVITEQPLASGPGTVDALGLAAGPAAGGDIRVDTELERYSPATTPIESTHMVNVFAHEIGHALGLPHGGTCGVMSSALVTAECNEGSQVRCGPQPVDYVALASKYGWRHGAQPLDILSPPRLCATT